jgi:hypothetical protein
LTLTNFAMKYNFFPALLSTNVSLFLISYSAIHEELSAIHETKHTEYCKEIRLNLWKNISTFRLQDHNSH